MRRHHAIETNLKLFQRKRNEAGNESINHRYTNGKEHGAGASNDGSDRHDHGSENGKQTGHY